MSRNKPNWKGILVQAKLEEKQLQPTDRFVLIRAYRELTGTDLQHAQKQINRLWALHVTETNEE
jgi:hypothetical protein